MSSVETTIQFIQDGMKKISDGISQVKHAAFTDFVKEQKLEDFMIDDEKEGNMKKKEVKEYYKGIYDNYEARMHALESEKKQIETFFQLADNTRKQFEDIMNTKESINNAYDVNINNIKIVINSVIKEVNKNADQNDPIVEVLPLLNNEYKEPRLHTLNSYVVDNMNKLEEWSGKKYSKVLYDSDIDGKNSKIFTEKIKNHGQLYFVVIDSHENVFGHYHDSVIDKIGY